MRVMRWRPLGAAGAMFLGLLATASPGNHLCAAQNADGAPETAPPQGQAAEPHTEEPQGSQASIHPDAVSTFVVRSYKIKPKKLWPDLLKELETSGYPPEEVDASRFATKTSFVDFEGKNFPEPVGDRPPEFGPDYPILQLFKVTEGKVSLEAIVTEAPRGSTLSVRARILVHGLNRRERTRVLTDRRSSGVIEKAFLDKLEGDLGLKPL